MARIRRRRPLAVLTAAALLPATIVGAAGGAARAGADGLCVVDPGAGSTWSPADAAAAGAGHALMYSIYDTGAWRYFSDNYFGREHRTGAPVDIALIDSGVAPVPGLDNGNVVHGPDLSFESQSKTLSHLDTNGHGTMMASIMVGRDNPNPGYSDYTDPTKLLGIAPQARVVSVKVADSQGAADVTQVIAGIDWVVAHAHDKPTKNNPSGFNIRVINLSYGVNASDATTVDALSYAVQQAWDAGIVVVAASGNGGRAVTHDSQGLTSPAYNYDILAVGSYDDNGTPSLSGSGHRDDFIPPYTSGSSQSNMRLPDIVTPGQHITGLHVAGSEQDDELRQSCADSSDPAAWTTSVFGPNDRFIHGSGTSEAAALASGAVALVLSKNPELKPDDVKHLLSAKAQPYGLARNLAGNGELDLNGVYASAPLAPSPQNHATVKGGSTFDAARGDSVVSSFKELAPPRTKAADNWHPCTDYWANRRADGTPRNAGIADTLQQNFDTYCVVTPLNKNRGIFGNAINVGSIKGTTATLEGAENVMDGARTPTAWTTARGCAAWAGMPLTGQKFVSDPRPGLGTVWDGCAWPRTNWAGQPWNTDSDHYWDAGSFGHGGSWQRHSLTTDDWSRHSLTGDDWTRFSLRDNGWS